MWELPLCVEYWFLSCLEFIWNKNLNDSFICWWICTIFFFALFWVVYSCFKNISLDIFLDSRITWVMMSGKYFILLFLPLFCSLYCPLRNSQLRLTSLTFALDWRFSASSWQCFSPQPSWPILNPSSGASLHAWPAATPKSFELFIPSFLASWATFPPNPVSCQCLMP